MRTRMLLGMLKSILLPIQWVCDKHEWNDSGIKNISKVAFKDSYDCGWNVFSVRLVSLKYSFYRIWLAFKLL